MGLTLALGAGCGGLWDGEGATDGGATGYGRPTLQITVSGTTTGELTPDSSSYVDVVDETDQSSGQLASSTLAISASAIVPGSGAAVACSLAFVSTGTRVAPIVAGSYQLVAVPQATAISSVSPLASESVGAAGDGWQCAGTGCDGAVLSLLTVDATHVEGFFSATLERVGAGFAEPVVCSFYLPTRRFQRR